MYEDKTFLSAAYSPPLVQSRWSWNAGIHDRQFSALGLLWFHNHKPSLLRYDSRTHYHLLWSDLYHFHLVDWPQLVQLLLALHRSGYSRRRRSTRWRFVAGPQSQWGLSRKHLGGSYQRKRTIRANKETASLCPSRSGPLSCHTVKTAHACDFSDGRKVDRHVHSSDMATCKLPVTIALEL